MRFTKSWKNFSSKWSEINCLNRHLKVWTHDNILYISQATFLMKLRQNVLSVWNYFLDLNSNISLSVAKKTTFTIFFELFTNLWCCFFWYTWQNCGERGFESQLENAASKSMSRSTFIFMTLKFFSILGKISSLCNQNLIEIIHWTIDCRNSIQFDFKFWYFIC